MADRAWLLLPCAVLLLQISLAVYFIPQKWVVCRVLYTETLARVLCMSSR
jgi:hypothetical protein